MANAVIAKRRAGSDRFVEFDHRSGPPYGNLPYDVTWEKLDGVHPSLPPEREAEGEMLHGMLSRDPKRAIPALERLTKEFPEVPTVKNWLSVALNAVGRFEDADALTDRILIEHPDYLFARINKALTQLSEGHYHRVPAILNGQMELHLLAPGRKVFHATEAAAMWSVLHQYYLATTQFGLALDYIDRLRLVAPDNPLVQRYDIVGDALRSAGQGMDEDSPDSPRDDSRERPDSFRQGSHMPRKDRNRKKRRR
jgi:tetratricopeptide (TPR) repeat protein